MLCEGERGDGLIDDHDHALLAVAGLAAEEPDGFGVVDHDGEDGDLAVGGVDGHEAGFDHGAGGRGVGLGKGDAGRVKGGLGDGVVLYGRLCQMVGVMVR